MQQHHWLEFHSIYPFDSCESGILVPQPERNGIMVFFRALEFSQIAMMNQSVWDLFGSLGGAETDWKSYNEGLDIAAFYTFQEKDQAMKAFHTIIRELRRNHGLLRILRVDGSGFVAPDRTETPLWAYWEEDLFPLYPEGYESLELWVPESIISKLRKKSQKAVEVFIETWNPVPIEKILAQIMFFTDDEEVEKEFRSLTETLEMEQMGIEGDKLFSAFFGF